MRRTARAQPSSIWLPSDVPGLVAEFYSEFVIKDGADLVSQWTDQSGQGNHAIQGTGANQPLWVDAQFNGYPGITLNGSSQWFSIADIIADFVGDDLPHSIFIVHNTTSAPTFRTFLSIYNHPGGSSSWELYVNNGQVLTLNKGGKTVTASSFTLATNSIMSVIDKGTLADIYENGGQVLSNGDVDVVAMDPNTAYIGTSYGAGQWFYNGKIAAILIYGAISDANRQLIETYLNTKYAIY